MEASDLVSRLQSLGLQHKSAVSLVKTEPHYVLDMAAQHKGGEDSKLAVTSSNYTIRLFSRFSLAQTQTLTGHTDVISGIHFLHSDPELLVTSSHDKTVRVWDCRASSTQEVQLFKGESNTNCSFLSCDVNASDRVICAGTEKTSADTYLLFWDRRKAAVLGCYEDSHDDDVTEVRFHPTAEKSLLSGSTDGLVNVFDVMQTSEDDALMSTYNTESSVEKAGWCGPDARYVYCITHMRTWHVWDTDGDEDIQQISDVEGKLESLSKVDYLVDCIPAATPSNQYLLVAGTHSGDLHFLDLSDSEDPKVVSSLKGGHSDTVRCLHWDRETETLVTGGEDSLLCLWSPNAAHGKEVTAQQRKVKPKKVTPTKRTKPYTR
ncbi:WD repeat-containing protein 89-like [Littorina saxatilis]|uniref:WD repeat-containing protein 89 n=1 Tax=Littorina saxatilis TaxID=31220 RepID=A0AAN9C0H0_9CAEN